MRRWLHSLFSGGSWNQRIIHILAFAMFFVVAGNLIPYTYHRYFDNRDYFYYVGGFNLDRKLYNKCDTILISGTLKSEVNLGAIATLIYFKRVGENRNLIDTVKENHVIPKTGKDGLRFTIPRKIPCEKADFKPGVYELFVQYEYEIDGFKKSYSLYSPQFTIVEEPIQK